MLRKRDVGNLDYERLCKIGDDNSIKEILDMFCPEVCVMIRNKHIHQNDVEDAVQESIIRVIHCIHKFNPQKGEFLNYVRSSISKFLNSFRGQLPTQPLLDNMEPCSVYPCHNKLETDDLISVLHSSSREKIVRSYYGLNKQRKEKSLDQIACEYGQHPSKIKSELIESLKIMRHAGGG